MGEEEAVALGVVVGKVCHQASGGEANDYQIVVGIVAEVEEEIEAMEEAEDATDRKWLHGRAIPELRSPSQAQVYNSLSRFGSPSVQVFR